MRVLTKKEARDPATLLKCLLGKNLDSSDVSCLKPEVEGTPEAKREFEIQCLFFMYLCARRSFVKAALILVRVSLKYGNNDFQNDCGGRLESLGVPFAAARCEANIRIVYSRYILIFPRLGVTIFS